MALEIEQSLHVMEERDQTLSQLLECGALLSHLLVEASHCITHLTKLKTTTSEISWGDVTLVIEVRAQQVDLSGSLQVLAEELRTGARGQAEARAALATLH